MNDAPFFTEQGWDSTLARKVLTFHDKDLPLKVSYPVYDDWLRIPERDKGATAVLEIQFNMLRMQILQAQKSPTESALDEAIKAGGTD